MLATLENLGDSIDWCSPRVRQLQPELAASASFRSGFQCPQDNPALYNLIHSWGPQLSHLWMGPRLGMPASTLGSVAFPDFLSLSPSWVCLGSPQCLPQSLSAIFFFLIPGKNTH